MTARDEMETTVAWPVVGGEAFVYSTVPKHVRRMERDERFTRRDGDGVSWGSYVVSSQDLDPLRGVKRRSKPMTDEQRDAARERLRAAREGKG